MGKKSSFDKIKTHLTKMGAEVAVASSRQDDLETLVRRCDEVRSLGSEYGSVELSPYMLALLKVSAVARGKAASVRASAAASV